MGGYGLLVNVFMDFNRSQTPPRAPQPQQATPASGPAASKVVNEGNKSPMKTIIAAVVSLVVVVALVVAGFLLFQGKSAGTGMSAVDSGKFQAVFLTNGQVYFGKLSGVGNNYVDLENIYYLQVQQSVQPSTDKPQETDDSQVSLTKLGNELHGPTDEMHISKDQVLFWENLKEDSTVVKAIKDYEDKN